MHTVRFTREAVTFLVCQTLLSLLAAWAVLAALPAAAQTCPPFPARGVQVIDALYNPALANGNDDDRRQLTRTILEQLAFEFPADGWTWKSADPGRPPSKDSLARLVNGRLCNWDWQNGTTRRRGVQAGQEGDDITGQNPIPVAAINHLVDASPAPPSPGPVPAPPGMPGVVPIDYERLTRTIREEAVRVVLEQLQADRQAADAQTSGLAQQLASLQEQVATLREQVAGVGEQVRRHDEEPSWLTRRLKDAKTYVAIAGALAGFVARGSGQ